MGEAMGHLYLPPSPLSCFYQGLAIEENQKHGLDQLTMFKKSQSEGLLRFILQPLLSSSTMFSSGSLIR